MSNPKLYPEKKDQLAFFSSGDWGQEECIVNHEGYCGKRVLANKGFQNSMHYHKLRTLTIYQVSGKILFEVEDNGKISSRIMTPGDVQHMRPNIWHNFTVLEDSEIFKFSTLHLDSDSYCKEEGQPIQWKKVELQ